MNYIWIIIIALYFLLTHLVGKYFGAKREIGYRNSVFWSILSTPIIGLIITLFSEKTAKE